MTYDSEDRGGPVAVEEPGGRTGLIVGAIVVLVIVLLIGSFLVSGLFGAGAPGGSSNGGAGQPLPSLNNPASS